MCTLEMGEVGGWLMSFFTEENPGDVIAFSVLSVERKSCFLDTNI